MHLRSKDVPKLFENISEKIEKMNFDFKAGDLAHFLFNYVQQVECLLHIISVYCQEDCEGYLVVLDKQIKYFFAHNLFHCTCLMPVHLAQMNELKHNDPNTWAALKEGAFCVKKCDIPLTHLFVNQALEQHIWGLNGHGSIKGLSQLDGPLREIVITMSHVAKIVQEFLNEFPHYSASTWTDHIN